MENNNVTDTSMETASKGLIRSCKLFVKVDKNGKLIDTLAISDVVNFGCYENIVSSVRRIVAMFIGSKPDNVFIDAVFYYKKRARSTRMNPSKILTTTDCFRAIAEHPSEEIQLGVEWHSGKEKNVALVNKLRRDLSTKITSASKQMSSTSSEVKSENDEIPNKKQKLEQVLYKTYMPVSSTADPKVGVVVSIQSGTTQSQKTESSTLVFPVSHLSQLSRDRDKVTASEDASKKSSYTCKHPSNNEYLWPEKTNCEVILNYDGVTERRQLPARVSVVIKAIMKGNYSYLRPDIVSALVNDQNPAEQKYYPDFSGDVTPQLNNQFTKTDYPIIKSVRHAKAEIMKILSVLSLTKTRFEEVLKWTKMLKLEETRTGRFYLSERNLIDGRGPLKITYDRNEQSLARLSQIDKLRSEKNQMPKLLQPSVSVDPKLSADQLMFFMPAAPGLENSANGTKGNAPGRFFVSMSSVHGNNTETGKTSQIETPSCEIHFSNGSNLVSVQQQKVANLCDVAENNKTIKENKVTKTRLPPNILRPRTRVSCKNVPAVSEEPTPMHLFRTYETENNPAYIKVATFGNKSEKNMIQDFHDTCIKLEPVEYNSDAPDDHKNDFDKTQFPPSVGLSNNSHSDICNKSLISDATLPQTNEIHGLPMDLLIKEEPVDDYVESGENFK